MGEVRFTSEVSAPVAEVFRAHIDGARIPDWFPGVQAIEDVSGPLDRVGTTYLLRFSRYAYKLAAGPLGRLAGRLPAVRKRAEQSMRSRACGTRSTRLLTSSSTASTRGARGARPKPIS